MKTYFDDISPAPELIIDERVKVITPVSIGGATYYEGYLYGMTDETILGIQAEVGAWTAINKGGTQYDIIWEGLPSAGQALIDFNNSRIICPSMTTLYFCYYDYGRVYKCFEIGGEIIYCITGMMDCDSETTVRFRTMDKPARYIAARIVSETPADGDVIFNFINLTTSSSEAVTISNEESEGQANFTKAINLQPGDTFAVSVKANNGGIVNPTIYIQIG